MSEFNEIEAELLRYGKEQRALRNARGATKIPAELEPGFNGKVPPEKIATLREQYTAEVLAKNPSQLTSDEKASLWEGIEQWAREQKK